MRMQLIDHQIRLQLPAYWPRGLRPEALNQMDHPTPFLVCDLETARERYAHLTTALPRGAVLLRGEMQLRAGAAGGLWRYAFDSEGELYKLAQHAPGSAVYARLRVDDSPSLFPLSRKFGAEAQEARALLLLARKLGCGRTG